ncbi:MAG: hypothetical protein HY908_02130 [Myxococcales bacterium]|nr:hypothetical protein [Myxococcales bacterium]
MEADRIAAALAVHGPAARASVAYCEAALAAAQAVPEGYGGALRERGIKLRGEWLDVARAALARLDGSIGYRPRPTNDRIENLARVDPGHAKRDKQLRFYVAAIAKAALEGGAAALEVATRQVSRTPGGVIAMGPSVRATATRLRESVAREPLVSSDDLALSLAEEVAALDAAGPSAEALRVALEHRHRH